MHVDMRGPEMVEAPNPTPPTRTPAKGRKGTAPGRRPLRGAVQALPPLEYKGRLPDPGWRFSRGAVLDSRESQVVSGLLAGPRAVLGFFWLQVAVRHTARCRALSLNLPGPGCGVQ